MSATLMRLLVLLFSSKELTVLARLKPVGDSLTSLNARLNSTDAGVLPGNAGSLAETVTA